VSVTTTPLALDGPKFVTEIVLNQVACRQHARRTHLAQAHVRHRRHRRDDRRMMLLCCSDRRSASSHWPCSSTEPLAGAVTVTLTLLTWPLVNVPRLQPHHAAGVDATTRGTYEAHAQRQGVRHHHAARTRRPKFVTEIV